MNKHTEASKSSCSPTVCHRLEQHKRLPFSQSNLKPYVLRRSNYSPHVYGILFCSALSPKFVIGDGEDLLLSVTLAVQPQNHRRSKQWSAYYGDELALRTPPHLSQRVLVSRLCKMGRAEVRGKEGGGGERQRERAGRSYLARST